MALREGWTLSGVRTSVFSNQLLHYSLISVVTGQPQVAPVTPGTSNEVVQNKIWFSLFFFFLIPSLIFLKNYLFVYLFNCTGS